ncbi:hypothetical protein BpHYR1_050860 [Brachionus plicatilis]|uniref:Uncharacterized protein n=1 Tax=Brachionus plicatilis TaxID=10195 RepID=A0A3M7PVA2_BRAPC|nr:hypothetical protein BpHYR1_050860 [Brachionus plicatilis]
MKFDQKFYFADNRRRHEKNSYLEINTNLEEKCLLEGGSFKTPELVVRKKHFKDLNFFSKQMKKFIKYLLIMIIWQNANVHEIQNFSAI